MGQMGGIVPRLASAIDDLEAKIAVGGRLPCEGLAIRFADGERLDLVVPKRGASRKALSALLAAMAPAPFGAGKQTRIDRKVRHALQISASKRPFDVIGLELKAVLEEVAAALLREPQAHLIAEPLSINAYGPGGHFARHKDTPRAEGMVGSLVVCLPFPFTGGELSLEHGNQAAVFDFSSDIEADSGALAWAAFFSDVDHEISAVASGHRVTISYALRQESARRRTQTAAARRDETLLPLFREAALDPELRQSGAILRIPCMHQYAATAGGPSSRQVDEETARELKGRDRDVALAALAASLPVELVHCLAIVGEDDSDELTSIRLAEPPTRKEIARIRSRIATAASEPLEDELAAEQGITSAVHTLGSWHNGVRIGSALFSSTGYYGNEAYDSVFYVSSVLDVRIASATAGEGRRVRHKKFGAGVVVSSSEQGGDRSLRVRFDSGEERTILESFFDPVAS